MALQHQLSPDDGMPRPQVRAADVADRAFPRPKRHRPAVDEIAVREWLRTVAAAYEALEDEVERLRAERDALSATVRGIRDRAPAATVRSALLSATLKRRPFGYACSAVDALLQAASDELVRLQTRAGVLEAQLDQAGPKQSDESERIEWLELQVAELLAVGLDRTREAGDARSIER